MDLRLRPYALDDESAARRADRIVAAEDSTFLLGFEPDMSWGEFLQVVDDQRRGLNLSKDRVRAEQLAATVEGNLVGRASVRFALNEFLANEGGHIGYVVLPEYRRRGYATEILRQSLVIARAGGVEEVLMYCSDANVASYTVIERCGGVLDEVIANVDEPPRRRYWIR